MLVSVLFRAGVQWGWGFRGLGFLKSCHLVVPKSDYFHYDYE